MINPFRQGLVCAGSIFILVALILIITHGSESCQLIQGGNTNDCSQGVPCQNAAYSSTFTSSTTNTGSGVQFNLTCPWSTGTSVMTYIALIASAAFLGIFAHSQVVKSTTSWLGVLGIVTLLTSFVLMIIDLVNGNDYINMFSGLSTNSQTYSQSGFISNIIFISFTLILVIVTTVLSIRSQQSEEEPSTDFAEMK